MFILLYNPPIRLPFSAMHIVGACSWLYLFFNIRRTKVLLHCSSIQRLFLGFILLFLYLFVIELINRKPIISCLMPVYFFIDIIPFGLSMYIRGEKRGAEKRDFINILLFCAGLQCFTAFLALLIPGVQEYIIQELL